MCSMIDQLSCIKKDNPVHINAKMQSHVSIPAGRRPSVEAIVEMSCICEETFLVFCKPNIQVFTLCSLSPPITQILPGHTDIPSGIQNTRLGMRNQKMTQGRERKKTKKEIQADRLQCPQSRGDKKKKYNKKERNTKRRTTVPVSGVYAGEEGPNM